MLKRLTLAACLAAALPASAAIRGVPADEPNCQLVGAIGEAVAKLRPRFTEAESRNIVTARLREAMAGKTELPSYVPTVFNIAWSASVGSPNTPPERARVLLYKLCISAD